MNHTPNLTESSIFAFPRRTSLANPGPILLLPVMKVKKENVYNEGEKNHDKPIRRINVCTCPLPTTNVKGESLSRELSKGEQLLYNFPIRVREQ